jgi:hypothetical protein
LQSGAAIVRLRIPGELTATVTATTATGHDQRHTSAAADAAAIFVDVGVCYT